MAQPSPSTHSSEVARESAEHSRNREFVQDPWALVYLNPSPLTVTKPVGNPGERKAKQALLAEF
jgi:hypothetical protein